MALDDVLHNKFVATRTPETWCLRAVQWKLILRYQRYGAVLLFVAGGLASGLAHWTMTYSPTLRPALLYDATISYPQADSHIISNTLATLLNWICFIIAVLAIELVVFHKHHSWTAAIAAVIHHSLFCIVIFFIVVGVAEVTKPFTGRLRPDFMARCQPINGNHPSSNFSTAAATQGAALGKLHYGELAGECTNAPEEQRDGGVGNGRLSFVSGHASNSMSVAWYTAIYMMWSLYLRRDNPYMRNPHLATTVLERLGQEVLYALAYGLILVSVCLSWFIGMTRFWDNVHAISDIIGGFLVAIVFSTPLVINAIGLHTAIEAELDDELRKSWPPVAAAELQDDSLSKIAGNEQYMCHAGNVCSTIANSF